MKTTATTKKSAAWSKVETYLNALMPRERAIVLAALAMLLVFVWYQAFAAPQWQKMKIQKEQTQTLSRQWEALGQQLGPLEQRLADDPNKILSEQNRQLLIQIEQQERSLQARLERLVKPEEMAGLLETLLRQDAGLAVISIEKLPAIPVIAVEAGSEDEVLGPSLYRHGLKMVFEGGYFDTLAYLKRLEGMEKAILFNNLKFEVTEFPGARVTLEVETLSLEKGWMGV